jgi:hypothetical protein
MRFGKWLALVIVDLRSSSTEAPESFSRNGELSEPYKEYLWGHLMKFAVLAAAAILGSAATAKAQAPQPDAGQRLFEAPYPFTADSLWAQLSQVAALKGAVNRAALESIFGVKLKDRVFGPSGATWSGAATRAPADWYYDLTYWYSEKGAGDPASRNGGTFKFGWARPSGVGNDGFAKPPAGTCIRGSVIGKDLVAQGYMLQVRQRESMGEIVLPLIDYEYATQDWRVRVVTNLDTECLVELQSWERVGSI